MYIYIYIYIEKHYFIQFFKSSSAAGHTGRQLVKGLVKVTHQSGTCFNRPTSNGSCS